MSCFLCLTHPVALCAPSHSCVLRTYLSPTRLCHFISFAHLSKPCIFSTPDFTPISGSSPLHPHVPSCFAFFCANFELHEITYHQRLSQALSFRAGNLSIHSSWKLRNMPGITLVRCDIMCEKTHSIPCFAFYVALCVFPPSLSILCPPMTNHLCPGEGYPSEKQSFSFFSIILSSFTAM